MIRAVRTSQSDPIRVDFLPADERLGPGRLGMTFAPGKKAPGIAGQWERDLDADLERLVREYDARVLVSLLAPHEYEAYGILDLPSATDKHQLELLRFPIPDIQRGSTGIRTLPHYPAFVSPGWLPAHDARRFNDEVGERNADVRIRLNYGRKTGILPMCFRAPRRVVAIASA